MSLALTWGDLWVKVVAFLQWVWSFPELKFMLCHIVVNFVVAVAATIVSKEFVLARLAEFLYRKILPYFLVYAVFRFFGEAIGFGSLAYAVFVIIEGALVGDLLDNLSKLGIKIPRAFTKEREENNVSCDSTERK